MFKISLRTETHLIIVALCIFSCVMTGCVESTFTLASESRLPRFLTLPPGLARADVSVTMNYYTSPLGGSAKFILKDKNGRTLTKATGKCRALNPKQPGFVYPAYEVITVNGTTEIIEHRKMEPIFYVTDASAEGKSFGGDRTE